MTQVISRQMKSPFISNYEEDNWDDIEFPETGLLVINNDDDYDYGLSTTTRDMSEMTIQDSSDEDSMEDYYFDNCNSSKSTPLSSPSSISRVKELMINSVKITNNNEEFSGLITRIGGENNKVIAVGDDWDNDMEIPEDGLANLTITTNKKNRSRSSTNDFEFESWDEEEEQDATAKNPITSSRELIIKRIEDPLKVLSKPSTAKSLESFDDDFDFSGVDLNNLDLSKGALKSHQEVYENSNNKDPFGSERLSSRNSSRLSILPSPAPTNGSLGSGEEEEDLFDDIQFPEHMDSLTLTSYNDDNDFENELDIGNESVFDPDHLKNKNIITRPNPTQQKRTRRESFTIEFNNPPKDDCSNPSTSTPLTDNKIHSKNTSNTSSPIPLHILKTNKVFSKSPTPSRTRAVTTISPATKNTSKSTTKSSPNRSKSPQDSKHPLGGLVKKPMFMMNNTERSKNTSGVTNFTSKQSSKKTASTSNNHAKSSPKTNQTISMPSDNKKSYQRNKQNVNPNINHKNTLTTISNTNTPNVTPNVIPNVTPASTPNSTPNANPKTNINTNSTLEVLRKPKGQQNFGDGTELDGFDDLPISIERERSYTSSSYTKQDRRNSVSSVGSKTDNSDNLQHHRKHKKTSKRKKPQLIRNLNIDKNPKVVGEMVYNPLTERWDGNDAILKDFDNILTSPIRPALISNMNNRITNAKSFQVVGKMKFDPIKMCWNNDSSDDDNDILARFDNDDDDSQNCFQASSDISNNNTSSTGNRYISLKKKSKHQPVNVNSTNNNSNDFQVGSEFDITPGFLAALLASERQHRNEITRWYPGALSKKNDSRFGLRGVTLQRSYLYDLRNNHDRKNNSSSSNNSKIRHKNRSGGLFEAARNLTRHERRHFC